MSAGAHGGPGTLSLALFGHPVGHSRSAELLDGLVLPGGRSVRYGARDVPPGRLEDAVGAIRRGDLDGANVTVPHKTAAARSADRLDAAAAALGAVNVLARTSDGSITGANTDVAGFLETLDRLEGPRVERAAILGFGGAARAVRHALGTAGVGTLVVTRRPDVVGRFERAGEVAGWDDPALAVRVRACGLVVQATPLGMVPHDELAPPLPPAALHDGQRVVDLVYAPWETRFLALARSRGARAINGWPMLVGQAAGALDLWAGPGAGEAVRARARSIEPRDPAGA